MLNQFALPTLAAPHLLRQPSFVIEQVVSCANHLGEGPVWDVEQLAQSQNLADAANAVQQVWEGQIDLTFSNLNNNLLFS